MIITRIPRVFEAVWNDDGTEVKGATFQESIFIDGVFWRNELTPVAPDSFGQFGTLFANQLQIQYDALLAEKAILLAEKESLQNDKVNAANEIATKTQQVEALAKEKADLLSQITAVNEG